MAIFADFKPYPRPQSGGYSKARSKHSHYQGIACPDHFKLPPYANAERFHPFHLLIFGLDAPHNRADARFENVQAHPIPFFFFFRCHCYGKICLKALVSIHHILQVDVLDAFRPVYKAARIPYLPCEWIVNPVENFVFLFFSTLLYFFLDDVEPKKHRVSLDTFSCFAYSQPLIL